MSESKPAKVPAPSTPTHADLGGTSARSLLILNNILAIMSNATWWIASPFVPLYLVSLGASVAGVGVVLGISGIVPLLVSLYAGALADERGPVAVAQGSVLMFGLAGVLLMGVHTVVAVGVAYTLMGIGNIGFAVAPQAVVAFASGSDVRLRNFGYYSLWSSAGAVVGPLIGGIVARHFGYTVVFALVWLLMVPAFATAASMRGVAPAPRPVVSLTTAHRLVGTIVRQPGVGAVLFISFMVVCGQTLQQSFYPIYLQKVGLSETLIGVVFAAVSLCAMAVRSVLSSGVERFGHASLLLGATTLAAISLGITPLLRSFWPLVLAAGLMGASTGLTMPMTMSLMVDSVAPEFRGVAFGIRQGVQRLAAVLSPIVFGVVIATRGIESGFVLGALTVAGTVPIMARVAGPLRRRRRGR